MTDGVKYGNSVRLHIIAFLVSNIGYQPTAIRYHQHPETATKALLLVSLSWDRRCSNGKVGHD